MWSMDFRIEHDTMGEVHVPAHALYSAQTQRAVDNFPISGITLTRRHIEASRDDARLISSSADASSPCWIAARSVSCRTSVNAMVPPSSFHESNCGARSL